MTIEINGLVTLRYSSDDDQAYMDCWLGYKGLDSVPTAKLWTNYYNAIIVIFEYDRTIEIAQFPSETHLRDMIHQRYRKEWIPVNVWPKDINVRAIQEEICNKK